MAIHLPRVRRSNEPAERAIRPFPLPSSDTTPEGANLSSKARPLTAYCGTSGRLGERLQSRAPLEAHLSPAISQQGAELKLG